MQLIITIGKIHLAKKLTVCGGARFKVDDSHGVAPPVLADVQQGHISDLLRRSLHGHAWRGVKGWVRHYGHIHPSSNRVAAKGWPQPMLYMASRSHVGDEAARTREPGNSRRPRATRDRL